MTPEELAREKAKMDEFEYIGGKFVKKGSESHKEAMEQGLKEKAKQGEEMDIARKELQDKFKETDQDVESDERFDHLSSMKNLKVIIESSGGKVWGELDQVLTSILKTLRNK